MEAGNPLLSTAYLPPLAYMLVLKAYPQVSIEIHETYPRQTWRNRCRIYTANGLLDMSIPVIKPNGNHTRTKDVILSKHLPWQKTHWHTITAAYARSPYFIYYRDLFAPFYLGESSDSLPQWNLQLLTEVLTAVGMNTSLNLSSHFCLPGEYRPDYRFAFSPKQHISDWGQQLAWPVYTQTFIEKFGFQANLSCIDLLFNLGPDSGAYLESCLEKYAHWQRDRLSVHGTYS